MGKIVLGGASAVALLAILAMAGVTYATRVAGVLLVRRVVLGPRATAVLEAVPGCVLVAVIAPAALTRGWADALAAAVTLVAALRLPLAVVVVIGVASAALLRSAFG